MKMFRHNFPFNGYFPAAKYTDLKLSTADEAGCVACHKVVMAAVSRKLEAMIDKRGGNGHLVVRNIRFDILKKVVQIVYTESVEVEKGVDEQDLIDALDMLLIKFEGGDRVNTEVGQACHGKALKYNIFEDTMNNNEDNDATCNGNEENSRISSVEIPGNEFNMLEEDLNLSTGSSYKSQVSREKSREAFQSSRLASLADTSPMNYKVVTGGSTDSEDSHDVDDSYESDDSHDSADSEDSESDDREVNDENIILEGSSGLTAQVVEVDESNKWINSDLPEIFSPGASGSSRAPVLLKKNPASHSLYDDGESVSGSSGRKRKRIGDKELLKKHKVDYTEEFTRNEKAPEQWTDPPKYLVKCDYCDSKLCYKWYVRHLQTQHPSVSRKRRKCEICCREVLIVVFKHHKAAFHSNNKVRIDKNENIRKARVKCDECGKNSSYRRLSEHYQRVHPGVKLHGVKCGICGNEIYQVNLKHHLKLVHGQV